MATVQITTATFDAEVLESEQPVLVDFWASWCGPCGKLSPLVEKASEEHPEMKFCTVNVDDEHELAQRFTVNSIPTLVIFKGGKMVDHVIGAIPKGALDHFIEKSL